VQGGEFEAPASGLKMRPAELGVSTVKFAVRPAEFPLRGGELVVQDELFGVRAGEIDV
jgi:hypothetical protein